ncbi:hypothetical protein KFL_003430060 [Klebsormidium nitens]|uniref:Uncharacterized protein n=1 Tax=Klebsormidium nitens TaxID=105231 RepID=A0A0U9HPC6_KLENI|nr:hypothetical protein KFL_003430060 [Klebsormidium nitens]|eukprot:GAQ87286.1 hypothetical protein KFL_003430060 [Klebsormidium nitens]
MQPRAGERQQGGQAAQVGKKGTNSNGSGDLCVGEHLAQGEAEITGPTSPGKGLLPQPWQLVQDQEEAQRSSQVPPAGHLHQGVAKQGPMMGPQLGDQVASAGGPQEGTGLPPEGGPQEVAEQDKRRAVTKRGGRTARHKMKSNAALVARRPQHAALLAQTGHPWHPHLPQPQTPHCPR